MKHTIVGAAVAVMVFGLVGCSSNSEPVAISEPTPALPADASDQAGVACMDALSPKVDQKSPSIRNHSTRSVDDTFVTTGQVSKYVGGEAPRNYQFTCTTRYNGTFTSEVTEFTELARTTTTAPEPRREVPYTITKQDRNYIDVTVDAVDKPALQYVFDKIQSKIAGEEDGGGWFISFNCSTGGGEGYDNRIANGKFALDKFGQAQTGLKSGEIELKILPTAHCP
ncbi:hypothetical protein [Rhodococcus sp. (in: high G+C Gram-positive bacteria)]|uniref:hypothetical protein n=1 Tax=Rhodococcus sp. TaxID=1831 RepID=UPI001A1D63A3|nr:hypothetical protein [Rhodococcus sp. (in: high G+C Gram-positive bacteria)]MBJ7479224.1 hypothetical protein [Rhodococcus sp. (in: high G+C Gram-positive bacteria)]